MKLKDLKVYISVLFCLASLLTVASCQRTPEVDIVTMKSTEELINKASREIESGSIADRLNSPKEYVNSVSSGDGRLTVNIRANIVIPDADKAPIIQVSSGCISQEQADVLIQSLSHGTLYSPNRPRTKNEVMKEILEYREELSRGPSEEDEGFVHFDGNGNELSWEQWMEQGIAQLYEEYETAPEEDAIEPISGKYEVKDGASEILGENISDERGYEGLHIYNGNTLGGSFARYVQSTEYIGFSMNYELAQNVSRFSHPVNVTEIPEVSITKEQARLICDELVTKLSIPNMEHYSIYREYGGGGASIPDRCCWVLQYTRSFKGLEITYTSIRGDLLIDTNRYSEPWPYETLTFFVDDSGIVSMTWESPYVIEDEVTDDSALMDFSDVVSIFEKMFLVENDGLVGDMNLHINDLIDMREAIGKGLNIHVNIEEIRLGYARVAMQGTSDHALLVPAWDFFGTVTDENGIVIADDPERSFLTINAIDGSIINRGLGY